MVDQSWTKSDIARLFASLRRTVKNTCLNCGREFEGLTFKRYCSPQCGYRYRSKQYYHRRKQAERERNDTVRQQGGD